MGMQIWQKAETGQSVKLAVDDGGIPAGTVGVVTSVNDVNQVYTVRICGCDRFYYGSELEVIESEGIGAGQSAGTGSAPAVGENTNDGESDVSGVCAKCGAVLRQAEPVGQ